MGWLKDTLKELQFSDVMRERVALADQRVERVEQERDDLAQRVEELEAENAELRARLPLPPAADDLNEVDKKMLTYLFDSEDSDERTMSAITASQRQQRSVVEYHLDRLIERGYVQFRSGLGMISSTWDVTSDGRKYVVDNGLHCPNF